MELLQVKGNKIVDSGGNPVRLRGTSVGGWMNMENFINGHPGVPHTLRRVMEEVLDPEITEFFFNRLLDYFLSEQDIAFMSECGANVLRIPLNYRHFESDEKPFEYREEGFKRLENMVSLCAEHGMYAILDLHSVQGWQNPDWHCDNPTRHGLFWQHPHFQDRFVALWEEIARRFKGTPSIAGYNVMNEPVTTAALSRYGREEKPNWAILNKLYRRVVGAIRKIDPHHIIILEGDIFSNYFEGLEPPFAENLVYSSHNYIPPCFGPGPYPGKIGETHWDRGAIENSLMGHQGMVFAMRYNVPLWVGEFGCVFNGPQEEIPFRLRALEDQIGIFENCGIHWTTWTYKDVGVMGWVQLKPDSPYMEVIEPILEAKRLSGVDFWTQWLPETKTREAIRYIARYVEQAIKDPGISPSSNEMFLSQAALSGYVGSLMQPAFARCFLYRSMEEVDHILQSFKLENCRIQEGLIGIMKKQ